MASDYPVLVNRDVLSWKRLKDCWEAELVCGHKYNTGPGSIDADGVHVNISATVVRCPTCEGVARAVLDGYPRG